MHILMEIMLKGEPRVTSGFQGSTTACKLALASVGNLITIPIGENSQGIVKSANSNRDIVGKIDPTIPSAS